jgi:hypothetical protein
MKNVSARLCGLQWTVSMALCLRTAKQLRARRILWCVARSTSRPYLASLYCARTKMGSDTEPGIIPLAVQEVFDVIEEVSIPLPSLFGCPG